MPKCVECGKRGLFLKVNYAGQCAHCARQQAYLTEQINQEYELKSSISKMLAQAWLKTNRAIDVEHEILFLNEFVSIFRRCRQQCREAGMALEEWFSLSFEHMSDDRCDDYSQYEVAKERLATQTAAKDSLIKKQYEDMDLVCDLDHRVVAALSESEGVRQSEFGKRYDISIRDDVRNVIYHMEKCGALKRIPEGKSYCLFLQDGGKAHLAGMRKPSNALLDELVLCPHCERLRPVYSNNVCWVCSKLVHIP